MSSTPPRIHPTALIDPQAELADDVQVGPYAVIEGPVKLGPGCVVRAHAHLMGYLTVGRGNDIGSGCVLGDRPQHLQYNGEPTRVEIGDFNVFREHCTVHRAMPATGAEYSIGATIIGSHNFFMSGAHIAHDCRLGDHCILASGALIGGHCTVGDRVLLSGNAALHQFVRVGRLAMLSGCSGSTKDVPPFIVQQLINRVMGVNVVGMRRAGLSGVQISAVRRAFRIMYMQRKTVSAAMDEIERELGHIDTAAELVAFVRASKRGICGGVRFGVRREEGEAA